MVSVQGQHRNHWEMRAWETELCLKASILGNMESCRGAMHVSRGSEEAITGAFQLPAGYGPSTLVPARASTPQIPVDPQGRPVSLPTRLHSEDIPPPLLQTLWGDNPLGNFPFQPLAALH